MSKSTKKVLLVNLPFEKIYEKTKLAKMIHSIPPLSLSVLGSSLLEDGHTVKIFDFNLPENNFDNFEFSVKDFKPDFVGITFVTPLFREMTKITSIIKSIDSKTVIIGGGPHCSSYPELTLEESDLDIIVVGEGDFAIRDIVNGKFDGKTKIVIKEKPVENLDVLPFPAYHLYDYRRYSVPKSIARKLPAAWMESSRGCIYGCVYCNKNIFGKRFRTKSPERVVEEMMKLKKMGFKEVHFTDDAFTTDIKRAKKICDLLIEKNVNLDFALINGIRVNQIDLELLMKLKKAGCYKIFFGIESGNQQILNNIRKGVRLQQIVQAVNWAKEAGLEILGSFMIGLPGETEETMRDTIEFAKRLPLDLAKMSILIPLPATPIFEEWDKKGIIKTKDWDKFNFHTAPVEIYDHPNLSWEKITEYYDKFYREFYFRPNFIVKRIKNSFKNGMILDDIKVFLGTKWF